MPTLGASGPPTGVDREKVPPRIFMSYRRTDDANFTGRFHDKLIGVFGERNVFRDIDSIPAGTRFEDVITAGLADVDAVVALIGPTWSGRINASSDFVRMEIAHALQSDTPVIPVLIEDTPLPTPDSLPDDLKPMLDRQTVRVRRDPDFHRDAARVMEGINDAVAVQRKRQEAVRRAAEQAAQAEHDAEERRQAEIARRKQLEEELARANAKAQEERRAAEALAAEREQRIAELARLEEEATQRRINDGRARVAEIVESQAAREREAEAADERVAELRRELGGFQSAETLEAPLDLDSEKLAPAAAAVAATVDAPHAPPSPEPITAPLTVEPNIVEREGPVPRESDPGDTPVAVRDVDRRDAPTTEPTGETGLDVTSAPGVFIGRRRLADASRAEVGGGVLLLVATAWAVQALFDSKDGYNAFYEPWATDVLAVVLTAALLLPLVTFYLGGPVHAVTAGASVGYLAYQGLSDSSWFNDYYDGVYFPNNMVFIAVLLAAAWFLFRRGSPARPASIEHTPSRSLQIVAGAATLITILLYCNKASDLNDDAYIVYVLLVVAVGMMVLSVRRSVEATIVLGTLAAETAFAYLTYAIAYEDVRDRGLNVAIAAAVLTGAAVWRARHAAPLVDE